MKHTFLGSSLKGLLGLSALSAFLISGCATNQITPAGNQSGLFQEPQPFVVHPGDYSQKNKDGFIWPVKEGQVSSFFGRRKRDFHEGLDIRSNRGTAIYAARAGKVIYSHKRIRGYGNMIVIKHDAEMATVYAHNKKNIVRVGDVVAQGQLIGYVGATGKATGPHLHFEVRRQQLPEDPLVYLPAIPASAVASH